MAKPFVRTSDMNLVICTACQLGMKETPRNLGSRHKGCLNASVSFLHGKRFH